MKTHWLFILTVVAFSTQFVSSRTIEDELKDFCEIMPTEKMKTIAQEHLKTDKEFNEAIIYLQSNAWESLIRDVQQNTEWKKLKEKLIESGLNMDALLKSFFGLITNLKPIPNEMKTPRSLRAFFDDIELVLPIGKLLTLLHSKKQNSTIFQEFYKKMSSEEVHGMFERVRPQPEIRRLITELKSMGAKFDDMLGLFYGFMNWDNPSSIARRETSFDKNFGDFEELIPLEKMINISDDDLINNKESGEVLKYLQSPEFARIIETIKTQPQFVALKTYLKDGGINIEDLINIFSDIVLNTKPGLEVIQTDMKVKNTKNYTSYLDNIQATIPEEKFLSLYNNKMQNDESFRNYMKKLSEPIVKKMVEDIRDLRETQELMNKLQELGLKITELFRIIYALFGWGSPIQNF